MEVCLKGIGKGKNKGKIGFLIFRGLWEDEVLAIVMERLRNIFENRILDLV